MRGYLLDHTAFVSAMDAVAVPSDGDGDGRPTGGGRTLCATRSGDGTVRMWDCKSCREVEMVPVAKGIPTEEAIYNVYELKTTPDDTCTPLIPSCGGWIPHKTTMDRGHQK